MKARLKAMEEEVKAKEAQVGLCIRSHAAKSISLAAFLTGCGHGGSLSWAVTLCSSML